MSVYLFICSLCLSVCQSVFQFQPFTKKILEGTSKYGNIYRYDVCLSVLMSICLAVYLSFCSPSVYLYLFMSFAVFLSIWPTVRLSLCFYVLFICPSRFMSFCFFVCRSLCLSFCPSVSLSVFLSICSSLICLTVFLSICLSVRLFACLSHFSDQTSKPLSQTSHRPQILIFQCSTGR
jgi:hypothetical protein